VLRDDIKEELENGEEIISEYAKKQTTLNNVGVTTLLAKMISYMFSDISIGGLTDLALELCTEMMNGGNSVVANSLYEYLVNKDTDLKFLEHLRGRMFFAHRSIKEAKRAGAFGGGEGVGEDFVDSCRSLITTTRFIQLCCEGHNLKFQEFMRVQPMLDGNVDLISKVFFPSLFSRFSLFLIYIMFNRSSKFFSNAVSRQQLYRILSRLSLMWLGNFLLSWWICVRDHAQATKKKFCHQTR